MISLEEKLWIQLTLWRLMALLECAYSAGDVTCASPQYVKLETQGVISCAFPGTFFGIYWYDHENVTSDDRPLISFVEGSKGGPGHVSGEYDIYPNGSLVINSVSVLHNHFYGVTIVSSIDRDPMFYPVSVVVFASPVGQYPDVGCEDEKLCFLKVKSPTFLNCSIDRVGDVIDLSWILRTRAGNESTLSQQVTIPTSANELQSHRLDVYVPLKTSPSISLYVCSANSSAPEVDSGEAAILLDHGTTTQKELSPILLEKSVAETVTLECGDGTTFFLVWLKGNQEWEPIAYAVSQFPGERITNADGFILENDNSLTINAVDELSAGIYICLYSQDGTSTSHLSYEVTIQENGNKKGVGLIIFLVIFITMLLSLLTVGLVLFCLRRHRDKDTNGDTVPEEIQVGERLLHKRHASPTDKEGRVVLSSKDTEDALQLLKNASESKEVQLDNCFESVDNNGSALRLTSNVLVDPIATMRRLYFDFPSDRWREFDETEVKNILKYAARCKELEEIHFVNSVLPLELKDSVKEMKANAMVEWTTGTVAGVKRLNFKTGKWESNAGELLPADYTEITKRATPSKMQGGDAQADCYPNVGQV